MGLDMWLKKRQKRDERLDVWLKKRPERRRAGYVA